ncbi:MAG: hypothetical protein K2K46_12805 [Lachnospiraceae bacterium]|nr:hypothetical protein [Lachnospiraceae bacterium]
MKKSIMGVLTLLWVCMIVLAGCSSSHEEKIFSLENFQKITVTSISGEKIEVIDEDIKQQITDNITSIQFERGESSVDTNGFGPMVSWYNSDGDVIETISVMSNDTIIYNNYFWTAVNGSIDTEVINDVLLTETSSLGGVTDDAATSSEPTGEEDWEDKALLEEYASYGIEKKDNFYYYQGELVYIIKDQHHDSSVYLLNTDSKGTISIKVIRNEEEEITRVTYMTEEEVAKALPRILGGASSLDDVTMEATEYSDTNAEELADTFGILISLPENPNWIVDSKYYLADENNLRISYYDLIADADCTLLVSKNNNLNLPQVEYDETLNESWEGNTIGSQHIVVKVQHENNGENMVIATWEYNEYQFAIIGKDVNDSTPIPKVALYIIEKLD